MNKRKKTRMKNNSSDVKKRDERGESFLPVLLMLMPLDPLLILLFSKVEEDAVFIT